VLLPVTIFLSAFLLFQVQPLMGRYVLPWFGGTPAVWSVCLLFFQCILLAGYGYAHWLGRLRVVQQVVVHAVLLVASLVLLPVAPNAARWKPTGEADPVLSILRLLLATVGGPYFLLSATTPLLQRWFAASTNKSGWRLYALSNLGSFLALFSYPFLVEPFARLETQSWIWSGLYVVFVGACIVTARQTRAVSMPNATASERAPLGIVLLWLALAGTASALLLATTNLITQDVAVAPFLWILPLSLYLLSFILTFESDRWYRRLPFAVLAGATAPIAAGATSTFLPLWGEAGVYLLALFAVCMLCHGELARSRPEAAQLTKFYLIVSAGGVLGGAFVTLCAPVIFNEFTEYPLTLAAGCLLGLLCWLRTGALQEWTRSNFAVRVPMMALLFGTLGTLAWAALPGRFQAPQAVVRNFFGILSVVDRKDEAGAYRQITHGRIKHGSQYANEPLRSQPTSYFGPHGGVGVVMQALQKERPTLNVGVVGLGAGTMAAWGRPGDRMRFYEINPDDEIVARRWFTYLQDSKAKVDVAIGDARIVLDQERESGQQADYDLLVIDAFSSDAIPVHLLTAESADLYRRRLKSGGLLLLHISNRMLNLAPVVRGLAQHLGWQASYFFSTGYAPTGENGSQWILVTADTNFVERSGLTPLVSTWTEEQPLRWTDDFSSLWHVVRW
jgi:hypothetical protein